MVLLESMTQVFCQAFDNDEIRIAPEMPANDIDGWDSISHLNLILAIKTKYNIRFSQKELLTLKNIGVLLNCTRSKITT